MGITDVRERALAAKDFGTGNPVNWYWALSITEPAGDGGNFTEPVGNGYTRVLKANNLTNFPAPTTVAGRTTVVNGTAVTWPDPTGPWESIGWWGLFIALTGGTPEYHNKLDAAISPQAGNTPVEAAAGDFELEFASA